MESMRDIKNRIRSVNNTKQITKAMEVVSATKMRRSQELALNVRPFALRAFEILQNIHLPETEPSSLARPPLMQTRPVAREVLLVITSDKGLAGSFNANVLRRAEAWLKSKSQEHPVDVVTIGRKARDYFTSRKANVIKEYLGTSDYGAFDDVATIAQFLQEKFLHHNYDSLTAIYTNFRSTLRQEVVVRPMLPLTKQGITEMVRGILHETERLAQAEEIETSEYVFEPSAQAIFETLLPYLFTLSIYHVILESNASEHSARMMAMKKASDNAGEIISDLTLQFNKSRQASITQELIEITSGASAL